MGFQPGGTTSYNGNAGAFVALSASSIPNRRLFLQASTRVQLSLDGGTTHAVLGSTDFGRSHDLGVTNPNLISVRSDQSATGTAYFWTLDPGES